MRIRALPALFIVVCLPALANAQTVPAAAPQPLAEALAFEARLEALAPRLSAVTVALRIDGAQGSGVIVSPDGHVLTAAHMFAEPGRSGRAIFHDGRQVPVRALGRHERGDFGMLQLEADGPFVFAELGDSAGLALDTPCLATGHPGGYQRGRPPVLRLGQIRQIPAGRRRFLRTSCVINSGDSGGPLFDVEGRVIGIHSRIRRGATANYHAPIHTVRRWWPRLLAGENLGLPSRYRPGTVVLGVRGDDVQGGAGCRVVETYANLPAARAGLRIGDVIKTFAGQDVGGIAQLGRLVQRRRAGEAVAIEIARGGATMTVTAELEAAQGESGGPPEPVPALPRPTFDAFSQRLLAGMPVEAALGASAAVARRSTVEVVGGTGAVVALGCVVRQDGLVLTKASAAGGTVRCRIGDALRAARVVARDERNDLALLDVDARGLTPVTFAPQAPRLGQWLVSVAPRSRPIGVGVVSVTARTIPAGRGLLGVYVVDAEAGVRVARVRPDSAAEECGIEVDDVITAFAGAAIASADVFVDHVTRLGHGAAVELEVLREGRRIELSARLGRPAAGRGGRGDVSRRRTGFPTALQHDTVLGRADCGGPVVDARGRVVALNIARAGRTQTLAIPGSVVASRLAELLKSVKRGKRWL